MASLLLTLSADPANLHAAIVYGTFCLLQAAKGLCYTCFVVAHSQQLYGSAQPDTCFAADPADATGAAWRHTV